DYYCQSGGSSGNHYIF
nr:immunoglobulin light chain junction region [Macaca mulatta]